MTGSGGGAAIAVAERTDAGLSPGATTDVAERADAALSPGSTTGVAERTDALPPDATTGVAGRTDAALPPGATIDVKPNEWLAWTPLVVLTLLFGLWPGLLLSLTTPPVQALLGALS
ncbi:hypothetical protein ACFMQL_16120 [Nonomuraea fastidiosa]|uniref:hypothetical protein n=1 Tax=Nonomuraea TaxID=83681 RepID=UPI003251680B